MMVNHQSKDAHQSMGNNVYPPHSTVLFAILNSLSTRLNNTVLLMNL